MRNNVRKVAALVGALSLAACGRSGRPAREETMDAERGRAELEKAVGAGDVARVEALLGADRGLAAARDAAGISLAMVAMYQGHPEVARCLLRRRAGDLFEAASLGDLERVRAILAADRGAARAVGADGFAPLHLAAYFGQDAAAEALLDAGADLEAEARNPSRVRPLHSAAATGPAFAAEGRLRVARLLLQRGAEIDPAQAGGWTPLQSRALHGDAPFVALLLAHGADPLKPADDGRTALDMATAAGHKDVVRLLDEAASRRGR